MVELVVKSNVKAFSRFLRDYQKRQLPFAISQALNSTAFDVRLHVVTKTFPAAFRLRNKGFARGIMRVDKASKRDLIASVFDIRQLDYLPRHETGGVKRPREGQHIAIPRAARRTSRGVAKADRPKRIVESKRGFATKTGIFRRVGRGRNGKLRLMHALVAQARIRPVLRFSSDARRVALRVFDRHFAKALIKALRTAR